ncbi:MAG: CPBP family intramembrane glutamic endopeptidase [Polyangiaceae bacterium]
MLPAASNDPIARVRLWTVLPALLATTALVFVLFDEPGPERTVHGIALPLTVIAWWYLIIADATRRAGYHATMPSAAGVLKLSTLVALGGLLSKLLWQLIQHVSQLPRLGVVESPGVLTGVHTAQTLAFAVTVAVLLGPVAEELLFRGALFRKWRLGRLGPTKAALLSSALFSLLHSDAPKQILSALSATVLYTTTRTIWAPVVTHMLNNLFVVAFAYSAKLWPAALLGAVTDWRVQLAALVPALAGTLWLVRFLYRGWHTLGAPVDGVPPADGESDPERYRSRSPTTSDSDTAIATATR